MADDGKVAIGLSHQTLPLRSFAWSHAELAPEVGTDGLAIGRADESQFSGHAVSA
jgi:hypothetical protein